MKVPITKEPLKTRGITGTPDMWLKDKAQYDTKLWGCSKPCWIVDNKMYDLTNFAQKHPGGSHWINYTKGQDISEHFRVHHLNYEKAKTALDKFYIGECPNKQQPRFTFEKDGIFETVKERLLSKYSVEYLNDSKKSYQRAIVLFSVWLILMVLTGYYESYLLAIVTGFITLSLNGVAHNFVHKKPNMIKHFYLLSGFVAREWEIMHCLSHHIYTNTFLDYEFAALQPMVYFIRTMPENYKLIQIIVEPFAIVISLLSLTVKLIVVPLTSFTLPNFLYPLTLTEVLLLYIINGNLQTSIFLFITIQMSFGFFFGKIVFCGHRIPEVWTEGVQQIKQYGLHAVMTTAETNPNSTGYLSMLLYTGFNIHTIHHFFPTIDHEHLYEADQVLRQVCKERGIKLFQNYMLECNKKLSHMYRKREPFVMKIGE